MAYIKTDWKARVGSLLNRFLKEQETDRSVVLHNQPGALSQQGTKFSIDNMNKIEQGIFDAHELIAAVTKEVLARLSDINSKIPNQASEENQLADKNFVNSSVSNLAANYVTPDAAGEQQWESLDALRSGPWFHDGTPYAPTQNDYAIFINDDNSVWRAAFSGNLWSPTYKVNDTPFTAAQLAALNSQITAALVQKLLNPDNAPTVNSDKLITSGAVYEYAQPKSNIDFTKAETFVMPPGNSSIEWTITNTSAGCAILIITGPSTYNCWLAVYTINNIKLINIIEENPLPSQITVTIQSSNKKIIITAQELTYSYYAYLHRITY